MSRCPFSQRINRGDDGDDDAGNECVQGHATAPEEAEEETMEHDQQVQKQRTLCYSDVVRGLSQPQPQPQELPKQQNELLSEAIDGNDAIIVNAETPEQDQDLLEFDSEVVPEPEPAATTAEEAETESSVVIVDADEESPQPPAQHQEEEMPPPIISSQLYPIMITEEPIPVQNTRDEVQEQQQPSPSPSPAPEAATQSRQPPHEEDQAPAAAAAAEEPVSPPPAASAPTQAPLYPQLDSMSSQGQDIDAGVAEIVANVRPSESRAVFIDSSAAFDAASSLFHEHQDEEYFQRIARKSADADANTVLRIRCSPSEPHEAPKPSRGGVSGTNGKDGSNGRDGMSVTNGEAGEDGKPGAPGEDGNPGQLGERGLRGQDAIPVHLRLDGSVNNLKISGSTSVDGLVLGRTGSVWVDASGGRGGDGGTGGRGGKGGNGGNGGAGGNGGDAIIEDQSGGEGGKGGDGGRGGKGGDGGNGGSGGDGGNGGRVLLEASDPRLFMLVDLSLHGGAPGEGGRGGSAGPSGMSGKGGPGGRGGRGMHKKRDGPQGQPGHDGAEPLRGHWGTPGARGNDGRTGMLYFVVTDPQDRTKITEQGYKRFSVRMLGYKVRGLDTDDGVLEPGERIAIEQIKICNDGHLSLPKGCQLSMESNRTFAAEEGAFLSLPEVAPGEVADVAGSLRGSLREIDAAFVASLRRSLVTPPMSSSSALSMTSIQQLLDQRKQQQQQDSFEVSHRYRSTLELTTRCELLGRPFSEAQHRTTFDVEYPIRIGGLSCDKVMAPEDECSVRVDFSNLSTSCYYGSSARGGSNSIQYRVYLYDDFEFLGSSDPSARDIAAADPPLPGRGRSRIIEGSLTEIAPSSTSSVVLRIKLNKDAGYYSRICWKVELLFRGETIETREKYVRVCPRFDPSAAAQHDLLFITNAHVTRLEYLMFKRIFDGLNLRTGFYDLEMYPPAAATSASPAAAPWADKYHGKPILYCISDPHVDIKYINGRDIIKHFEHPDSGLVLIGDGMTSAKSGFSELLLTELFRHSMWQKELPAREFADYFMVNEPTREYMHARMRDIIKQINSEKPSLIHKILVIEYNPQYTNEWSFMRGKLYTYGRATIKQLSLNRLHRLIYLTHGDETKQHDAQYLAASHTVEDIHAILNERNAEFNTGSNFFEALLAVLCALSVDKKMELLLKGSRAAALQWQFTAKSQSPQSANSSMSMADLVRTVLYDDLKRQFFFKDQPLTRVVRLIECCRRVDAASFMHNGEAVYSVWLILSRLESHTMWRSLPLLANELNEKRQQLKLLKQQFEQQVFADTPVLNLVHTTSSGQAQIPEPIDTEMLRKEKADAEKDAEDRSRLKLQDLTKKVLFPLELAEHM